MSSDALMPYVFVVLPTLFLLVITIVLVKIPWAKSTQPTIKFGFMVVAVIALVIIWPLFSFLVSILFAPMAKAQAHHGWVDSWHAGKIAMLPVVFWSSTALYVHETWPRIKKRKLWLVLGIFIGAILYGVVFSYMSFVNTQRDAIVIITPLYLFVWFGCRAIQMVRQSDYSFWPYVFATFGTTPFWWYSVVLAKKNHASLPETVDCFIVTAASKGHERVVGPLITYEVEQQKHVANQQLLTFWRLETVWERDYPRFHKAFRRVYNRYGYRFAKTIRNPWAADFIYLALKPLELVTTLFLWIRREKK